MQKYNLTNLLRVATSSRRALVQRYGADNHSFLLPFQGASVLWNRNPKRFFRPDCTALSLQKTGRTADLHQRVRL